MPSPSPIESRKALIQPALKVADVAEAWGVSVNTVYAAIQSGDLPCLKFGEKKGTIRLRPEDVNAYQMGCLTTSSQSPKSTDVSANTGTQYGDKTDARAACRVGSATRLRQRNG